MFIDNREFDRLEKMRDRYYDAPDVDQEEDVYPEEESFFREGNRVFLISPESWIDDLEDYDDFISGFEVVSVFYDAGESFYTIVSNGGIEIDDVPEYELR